MEPGTLDDSDEALGLTADAQNATASEEEEKTLALLSRAELEAPSVAKSNDRASPPVSPSATTADTADAEQQAARVTRDLLKDHLINQDRRAKMIRRARSLGEKIPPISLSELEQQPDPTEVFDDDGKRLEIPGHILVHCSIKDDYDMPVMAQHLQAAIAKGAIVPRRKDGKQYVSREGTCVVVAFPAEAYGRRTAQALLQKVRPEHVMSDNEYRRRMDQGGELLEEISNEDYDRAERAAPVIADVLYR